MALISASNLEKSFGERTLFSDVSFRIENKDIIGFVGANGTGKTTLFRIITGEIEPDKGGTAREAGLSVGYMEQHTCRDSSATALDEILSVFSGLMETELQLERLSARLATDHSEALIAEHAALNDRFISGGGLTYLSRAKSALSGLGFSDEEINLPVSSLSGGQKSKIALGRLLLSSPKLLLLDEPTNHLDINAVEWLEEYIKNYSGAAVIISHDRFFLDRVCNRIFELEANALYSCDGNYTKYCEVKELRRLSDERQYNNTMKEISRIEGIITQQRQWNREKNIKTAESKEKQIERLAATLKKPDELPRDIHFNFEIKRNCGNDVLTIKGLSRVFGDTALYREVSIDIKKGERVFFIGGNGCGKTTLLKQIMSGGEGIAFGAGVEIGYFEQTHANLNLAKTVLDEVWDACSDRSQTDIRNALAAFLFKGDDVFKLISELSGGERAKVALCKLMLSGSNLLFLDEPTNHLDIYSREALETALSSYGGTLVMVSHDRYFINRLSNKICSFENGTVRVYKGDYDNYLRLRPEETAETVKKPVGKGGEEYKKRKQDQAGLRRLKTAVAKCETEIAETESRLLESRKLLEDPEVSADYQKAMELSGKIAELDRNLELLLEKWDSLSEELSEKEQ